MHNSRNSAMWIRKCNQMVNRVHKSDDLGREQQQNGVDCSNRLFLTEEQQPSLTEPNSTADNARVEERPSAENRTCEVTCPSEVSDAGGGDTTGFERRSCVDPLDGPVSEHRVRRSAPPMLNERLTARRRLHIMVVIHVLSVEVSGNE